MTMANITKQHTHLYLEPLPILPNPLLLGRLWFSREREGERGRERERERERETSTKWFSRESELFTKANSGVVFIH